MKLRPRLPESVLAMVISPKSCGTMIFEPLEIRAAECLVLEPLPLSVPRITPLATAVVGGRASGTVTKSSHWSANMPDIAPLRAFN